KPRNTPLQGNARVTLSYSLRAHRSRALHRNLSHGLTVDSQYSTKPLNLSGVSTYPLRERKSKVHTGMFGKPMDGSENVLGFISKLPHILAGNDLRALIRAILYARSANKPIIWV